jgi:hypothetical protein
MYVHQFSQRLLQSMPAGAVLNKGATMSYEKEWLVYNRAYVVLEQIKYLLNKLPEDSEMNNISENEEMDFFTLTTVANRLAAVMKDRVEEVTDKLNKERTNEPVY